MWPPISGDCPGRRTPAGAGSSASTSTRAGTAEGRASADTGGHLDLAGCPHPCHTGDLPPLLAWDGRAFLIVRTGRFRLADVIGRTVVIHAMPDDFATQPSGHSGLLTKWDILR